MQKFLILEDGSVFRGESFGAEKSVFGEIVFNTSMTGYQESLTDPSYRGQILTMSYPMIGNYGLNKYDDQSGDVHVRGFVVRETCDLPSHRFKDLNMHEYLKRHKVPGIFGIDTRALIIRIRELGTMRAAITDSTTDHAKAIERLQKMDFPSVENLVSEVSCSEPVKHKGGTHKHVVLIDCGVKMNILRMLVDRFTVTQVPFDYPPEEIMKLKPDGLVISNGPGDPSHKDIKSSTVRTIQELVSELPTMGICLGHQLLGLAMGAKTYKLRFGHRGSNQPVGKDGRVFITVQNHSYTIDAKSLEHTELELTLVNQNDFTPEGLRHKELPVFSVQFHPEAKPGPRDTAFLLDDFAKMMEGRHAAKE